MSAFVQEPQIIRKRTVVIIGRTGVGKSTFCNSILGSNEHRVGDGSISETSNPQKSFLTFQDGTSRFEIELIDTPGLFDTREGRTNDEVFGNICEFLLRHVVEVNMILIVMKKDNFTKEYVECLQKLLSELTPLARDSICRFVITDVVDWTQARQNSYLAALRGCTAVQEYVNPTLINKVSFVRIESSTDECRMDAEFQSLFENIRRLDADSRKYRGDCFKAYSSIEKKEVERLRSMIVSGEDVLELRLRKIEESLTAACHKLATPPPPPTPPVRAMRPSGCVIS